MKTYMIILLVAALWSIDAQAQDNFQFLDHKYRLAENAAVPFVKRVRKTDSLYCEEIFFTYTRKLHKQTFYTDSSLRKKQGPYKVFYSNGYPEISGAWEQGKKSGLWMAYSNTGLLVDSAFYKDDRKTGIAVSWYANGFIKDSLNLNADGSGTYVEWFDNGTPSIAGRFSKSEKKTGTWVFYHNNGIKSSIEKYSNDSLLAAVYFNEKGDTMLLPVENRKPEFSSQKNRKEYLQGKLYFPTHYKLESNSTVTVVIRFIVDEAGKVKDPFVYAPFNLAFDNIALEVIKHSQKWKPAISHNRSISSYHSQPLFLCRAISNYLSL